MLLATANGIPYSVGVRPDSQHVQDLRYLAYCEARAGIVRAAVASVSCRARWSFKRANSIREAMVSDGRGLKLCVSFGWARMSPSYCSVRKITRPKPLSASLLSGELYGRARALCGCSWVFQRRCPQRGPHPPYARTYNPVLTVKDVNRHCATDCLRRR